LKLHTCPHGRVRVTGSCMRYYKTTVMPNREPRSTNAPGPGFGYGCM